MADEEAGKDVPDEDAMPRGGAHDDPHVMDEMERMMVHTAYSTIGLRVERLERVAGVRTVLCLDEGSGGIIYKAPDTVELLDAARHAVPFLELAARMRLTARSLRELLDDDEGPMVLSVRTRSQEYMLCPADSCDVCVAVVQDLRPGADEDAITSLAMRQLQIWRREGTSI